MKRVIIIIMSTCTLGQAMEKIWHLDYVSRDKKPLETVTKRAVTKKAAEVDREEKSRGISAERFLTILHETFSPNTPSLMDLERKRIENERKAKIEQEQRLILFKYTLEEDKRAAEMSLTFRGKTSAVVTTLAVMQLAVAPLLVERKPSPILALQERVVFESHEQKCMSLPLKRFPAFHYDKFLPKNQQRYSKKRSHHIQQPCKR